MAMFERFASVYDELNVNQPPEEAAGFVLSQIGGKKGQLVDLACGTGKISAILAKNGYSVIGMDISEDMLNQAYSNCAAAGARVTFIKGDLRKFRLPHKMDYAVCICDGFNYLLSLKELKEGIEAVHNNVKSGAKFIFDLSTCAKYERFLTKSTYTLDNDDSFLAWSSDYDTKTRLCVMSLTCFERVGKAYERFDEIHNQRAHTYDEVVAVCEGKFKIIGVYDGYTDKPAHGESLRCVYVTEAI